MMKQQDLRLRHHIRQQQGLQRKQVLEQGDMNESWFQFSNVN
jgi:hypothetical protein